MRRCEGPTRSTTDSVCDHDLPLGRGSDLGGLFLMRLPRLDGGDGGCRICPRKGCHGPLDGMPGQGLAEERHRCSCALRTAKTPDAAFGFRLQDSHRAALTLLAFNYSHSRGRAKAIFHSLRCSKFRQNAFIQIDIIWRIDNHVICTESGTKDSF